MFASVFQAKYYFIAESVFHPVHDVLHRQRPRFIKIDGRVWPGGDPNAYPSVLLQTWRSITLHPSGRDPRLAPLTCRIFHACQFPDGALLLPNAMEARKIQLDLCGIRKYVFAGRILNDNTSFNHGNSRFDLLSPEAVPLSSEISGLLSFFAKLVYVQHIIVGHSTSIEVDVKSYDESGEIPKNVSSHQLESQTAPLLYGADYAETGAMMNLGLPAIGHRRWGMRFFKLLANADYNIVVKPPSNWLTSSLEQSDDTTNQVSCYRSVFSSGEHGNDLPPTEMSTDNEFFLRNNIFRIAPLDQARQSFRAGSPNLLPINETRGHRNESRGSNLFKRRAAILHCVVIAQGLVYAEVTSIFDWLEKQLAKDQKLTVKKVEISENMNDDTLQAIFNNADVAIGSHSALLSNILFMRPKALLVEILPYSVDDDFYMKFSRQLGLSHISFMSRADSVGFENCMKLQMELSPLEFQTVMDVWREAVERFNRGYPESHLGLCSKTSKWNSKTVPGLECARSQRVFRLQDIEAVRRAIYDRVIVPRLLFTGSM
jgi:hypothetical protein